MRRVLDDHSRQLTDRLRGGSKVKNTLPRHVDASVLKYMKNVKGCLSGIV